MINDKLTYLMITNFVPQHEYSANGNSSLELLDYSNFTNTYHTDFDDFKAQFVFSVRKNNILRYDLFRC